jgi:5'-phosphate synthase pdxT subunit
LKPVGLLTLQGDYEKHRQTLAALGEEVLPVRRPGELDLVSSLIIPGGESTTLTRLMDSAGLRQPLLDFAQDHPVMGTCAGLIMLSSRLVGETQEDFGVVPLGLLDCTVRRNGYGRQIDSFSAPVSVAMLDDSGDPFSAVFIRAPRIESVGAEAEVLIKHRDEPVAVRSRMHLGMTFHPELTADVRIHQYFLSMVREVAGS